MVPPRGVPSAICTNRVATKADGAKNAPAAAATLVQSVSWWCGLCNLWGLWCHQHCYHQKSKPQEYWDTGSTKPNVERNGKACGFLPENCLTNIFVPSTPDYKLQYKFRHCNIALKSQWMSESVIHLIRLIHLIHLFHLQTITILQPVDEWVSEEEGVGRVEPLHQTRCNPDQVHSKVHSVPGLLVLIFEYIFIRTRHDVIQINSSTFLLLPWVNS